jgi:alpha-beta hydrolase superfamily lysophospholipase
MFKRPIVLMLILLLMGSLTIAQAELTPQRVEVTAPDEQILVGDFYAAADAPQGGAPAVLLMHMNNGRRAEWEPLLQPLLDAGYNVLNVDLRGFGESSGQRNWESAVTDVQLWLDWLREQPGVNPDQIATIGGSIGSNLALLGCANDAGCVTAIALSPGLDYYGLKPETFLKDGLKERSALLIASHSDRESSVGVRQMASAATNDIGMRLYPGSLHGTTLLTGSKAASVIPLIIGWLDEHMR